MTTLERLGLITRALGSSLDTVASRPHVATEVKAYRERIEGIRSIDDFLKDDRVYRFAMKAFGLGDFAYAKAFMRRALTEGIDASGAFANRLTDVRYRAFVETFNFHRYGETTTIFEQTRQGTIDRYIRQSLEEDEGAQNGNVQIALYFQRKAERIGGPFDILADRALTQFAFTALGLPASTSALDIDKQAELLKSKLDFAALKTPGTVSKLMTRFAVLADATASTSAPSAGAGLLRAGSLSSGFGIDLMLAVQRAQFGRRGS